MLSVLRKTSKETSHEQLKTVLQEALSHGHIQRADTKAAAASVLADLENQDSELRKMLANLKPLQYVWQITWALRCEKSGRAQKDRSSCPEHRVIMDALKKFPSEESFPHIWHYSSQEGSVVSHLNPVFFMAIYFT